MRVDVEWRSSLDPPMQQFMARYERAWADPRTGDLASLWHEDAEMLHPEFTEPMTGSAAIMGYLADVLAVAPDLCVRPLFACAVRSVLFVEFEAAATFAGTRVVWRGVDRFELDGGRAARGIGYFDTDPIRKALAADPIGP